MYSPYGYDITDLKENIQKLYKQLVDHAREWMNSPKTNTYKTLDVVLKKLNSLKKQESTEQIKLIWAKNPLTKEQIQKCFRYKKQIRFSGKRIVNIHRQCACDVLERILKLIQ